MTRAVSDRHSATAAWTARRLGQRHPFGPDTGPEIAGERAEAFRAYADVAPGEVEALLRVERSA